MKAGIIAPKIVSTSPATNPAIAPRPILKLEAAPMIDGRSFRFVEKAIDLSVAKRGTNVVYQGIDKGTGAVKYVGFTQRAPAVRFGAYLNSIGTGKDLLRYRAVPGATNMSRINARIMEQTLINQHGLNNLLNIRNSIAPKNCWQYGIK